MSMSEWRQRTSEGFQAPSSSTTTSSTTSSASVIGSRVGTLYVRRTLERKILWGALILMTLTIVGFMYFYQSEEEFHLTSIRQLGREHHHVEEEEEDGEEDDEQEAKARKEGLGIPQRRKGRTHDEEEEEEDVILSHDSSSKDEKKEEELLQFSVEQGEGQGEVDGGVPTPFIDRRQAFGDRLHQHISELDFVLSLSTPTAFEAMTSSSSSPSSSSSLSIPPAYLRLMPKPSKISPSSSSSSSRSLLILDSESIFSFNISIKTRNNDDAASLPIEDHLRSRLLEGLSFIIKSSSSSSSPTSSSFSTISFEITIGEYFTLPSIKMDESYSLLIEDHRVVITSPSNFGAKWALETFLQLASLSGAKRSSSSSSSPPPPPSSASASASASSQSHSIEVPNFQLRFTRVEIATGYLIEDKPRFPWRGVMVDISRHFHPLRSLAITIDSMATFKLNVLHLHLSDDQGFRIESKRWPQLHKVGSDTPQLVPSAQQPLSKERLKVLENITKNPEVDVDLDWMASYEKLFSSLKAVTKLSTAILIVESHLSKWPETYLEAEFWGESAKTSLIRRYLTQQQVQWLVRYAAVRGIRLVPEIDVPGHATAILVAYPQFARPSPREVETRWGMYPPTLDPTKPEVYSFLESLFEEMGELFPDEYFHIGGDEVMAIEWQSTRSIQAFMNQNGISSTHELQAYFNQKMDVILQKLKKKMVGWDEILSESLPKETVIHSWRGAKPLAAALDIGLHSIQSGGYYLDHARPSWDHYSKEPLRWVEDESKIPLALGCEAAMWSEYVSAETLHTKLWPRTIAVAERFWSAKEVNDVNDMLLRLEHASLYLATTTFSTHLSTVQSMSERLSNFNLHGLTQKPTEEELKDAASRIALVIHVLEPENRVQTPSYTTRTPLTGLIDILTIESQTGLTFSRMVERLLQLSGDIQLERTKGTSDLPQLKIWERDHKILSRRLEVILGVWHRVNDMLQPLLNNTTNSLLGHFSLKLSQAGSLGLAGLKCHLAKLGSGNRDLDNGVQILPTHHHAKDILTKIAMTREQVHFSKSLHSALVSLVSCLD